MIMCHQQHCAIILLQRDIQRVDGFQVQVVGRLIQDQEIRLLHHQPAEDQPRGLTT